MHQHAARIVPALFALLPLAAQTRWVVDDDPGPGVDFATVQEAITAAAPGDVILIRAGFYPRFVLDVPLTLVGAGPAVTFVGNAASGGCEVRSIPSGEHVVLAGMRFYQLSLAMCDGVVVLDDCEDSQGYIGGLSNGGTAGSYNGLFFTTADTTASNCRDLRARSCALGLSLGGGNGWIELAQLTGARLNAMAFGVSDQVEMLVTNPAVIGYSAWASGPPCFGGSHLVVDATPAFYDLFGSLIIAGRPNDSIQGGPGYGLGCAFTYGAPGVVFNGSRLRVSGVTITSTLQGHPNGISTSVAIDVPVRADPTLRLVGVPRPGTSVTVAVDGEFGDRARLEVGRGPAMLVSPGSPVPRLVTPGRLVPLGEVPSSGTIDMTLTIPNAALPGDVYWLQAFAVDPLGAGRRTNSLAVVVRE